MIENLDIETEGEGYRCGIGGHAAHLAVIALDVADESRQRAAELAGAETRRVQSGAQAGRNRPVVDETSLPGGAHRAFDGLLHVEDKGAEPVVLLGLVGDVAALPEIPLSAAAA